MEDFNTIVDIASQPEAPQVSCVWIKMKMVSLCLVRELEWLTNNHNGQFTSSNYTNNQLCLSLVLFPTLKYPKYLVI